MGELRINPLNLNRVIPAEGYESETDNMKPFRFEGDFYSVLDNISLVEGFLAN